jgi:putative ABC transport system substrate-binding protein
MSQKISIAVCALLFALFVSAHAQQTKKVFRLGYLSSADVVNDSANIEAFRQRLHELGYLEGQNLTIEYRYAENKRVRYSELAAELVRLNVDVIVVQGGNPTIKAAMNATKMIPIVITGGGIDPVVSGVVESLSRPGGNVTGLTNLTRDLGGKRMELLKETVPRLARVAVLFDPTIPGPIREVKEDVPVAARALKLTVRPWEIRSVDDFDGVFAALNKDRPDGLYVLDAASLRPSQKRIAEFAIKSRLPSMYDRRKSVDEGGLMYYGADLTDSYLRVAYYVDKILKGAAPVELPVAQPTKFELFINLKTAKQIGLPIPPNVLARADKVIR